MGLDLCASTDTILTPEPGVTILPMGVFGAPLKGTYFLILGSASSTLSGLHVHPSLVDSDYKGEIKLLVSASKDPITVTSGQRLAQALSLPLRAIFK